MGREEVVHYYKVNLSTVWYLYSMETIELRDECVWITFDMRMVITEDFAQQFMLGMVDGLDYIFIVSGEIEEAAAFARRSKFGENVLAGQGHQVVGRIQLEFCPEMAEHQRCIIFELEIVLGGWSKLIARADK